MRALSRAAGSRRQLRVVDDHGIGADDDGVQAGALLVHPLQRLRAGDPSRVAGRRRDASVQGGGELGYHERQAGAAVLDVALQQPRGFIGAVAGLDLDPRLAQPAVAAAADPRIGVEQRVMHRGDAGGDQRPRARWGAAVNATWLQRHVDGGAPSAVAGLPQRDDLGVVVARRLRVAAPHDRAVLHYDGADSRVGGARSERDCSLLQRHPHPLGRRPGGGHAA